MARNWRATDGTGRPPILCLNGIDRTMATVERFAEALSDSSEKPGFDVFSFDLRGRGLSDPPKSSNDYSLDADCDDLIDMITALGLEHAHVVASSYGGMMAMSLASSRPGFLKSVVLNDASPVLDGETLARTQYWLRRNRTFKTWEDVAESLKSAFAIRFPAWNEAHWQELSKVLCIEGKKGIRFHASESCLKYLLALGEDLDVRTMWREFAGLKHCPLLLIKSEFSSTLVGAVLDDMSTIRRESSAGTKLLQIEGQGGYPLLHTPKVQAAVQEFALSKS